MSRLEGATLPCGVFSAKDNGTQQTQEGASPVSLVVKNLPASIGDLRDSGSIPGSRRFPGERHGNPLQYSCLESFMDRGASMGLQSQID